MIIIYTKWHIAVMCIMRDMQNVMHLSQHINNVTVASELHQTSSQRCFDVTVALLLQYVSAGDGTLNHDIIMLDFT